MPGGKKRPAKGQRRGAEQVVTRARRMAQLVERLPDELVRSFATDDPQQRVEQLRSKTTEILAGMLDVVGWIERYRHPGTADVLNHRLHIVTDACLLCGSLEIPEFSGGVRKAPKGEPSEGMVQAAILMTYSLALADSFCGWAETIEDEESARRPKTAVRTKKSTSKGDAQTKIIGALSAYHQFDGDDCLNLEPIGNNELARSAEVSGSTVSLFLQKQFATKHAASGEGRRNYRKACRDSYRLTLEIKRIRDELIPTMLWNPLPDDLQGKDADG